MLIRLKHEWVSKGGILLLNGMMLNLGLRV